MFFNNKKNEEKQDETIKEETPKENFVISDYAMERYKKSKYYDNTNLTNDEIELLFCDKKAWDISINNHFLEVYKKLWQDDFDYIVFPECKHLFQTHSTFKNCIFYAGSFEGEGFSFFDCSFYKNEETLTIDTKEKIVFSKIYSDSSISIKSCTELLIDNCKIDYLSVKNNLKVNNIKILRTEFHSGIILYPNIDKLDIDNIKFNEKANFKIYSKNINTLNIKNLNLQKLKKSNVSIYNVEKIETLYIHLSQFFDFFDLGKIKDSCYLDSSTFHDLNYDNANLSLDIHNSKVNSLIVYSLKEINLAQNIFKTLTLSEKIADIFISETTVERECNFTHLKNQDICVLRNNTFKKGIDFKFASINKLAIYKSSFKKLDFDCSFINEARFVQVKGLNEENEEEELSDKHFASKESLNYFKTITNEKE